jgi:hypothetical protein
MYICTLKSVCERAIRTTLPDTIIVLLLNPNRFQPISLIFLYVLTIEVVTSDLLGQRCEDD